MLTHARLCAAIAALFVSGTAFVQAQAVTQAWIRTAAFPPYTYGSMVALDADDNVISCGYAPGASDLMTTKYDRNGNELWQRHYTMASRRLVPNWVAVDHLGNVVVSGYPETFSSNPVQTGLLTLKYDKDGAFLWSDLYAATWGFATRSIVDAAGNIYVTGRGWFGTYDFVTIKYAPDGTRVWLDVFDQGGGFHTPTAMDLDANGNLVVTGGGLSGGLITALYDASGVRQWVVERVGSAAASVQFTGDGHFYLTGSLYSPATGNDFMVQKYDLAGHLTWERFYDLGSSELARKLGLDSQGNVYVTGIQSGGGYTNWLTMKIDRQGDLLWSRVYDAHPYNDEMPNFMVVGRQDEVYITGFGGPRPPGPDLSYLSMVTNRYDADGSTAWTQTHFEWASRGVGAALGRDNSLYVIGLGNSITTIKYAPSTTDAPPADDAPATRAFLAPYPNPFVGEVMVGYSLPGAGTVQLWIYDVSGRVVARLADGVRPAGVHRVTWTGRDDRGAITPAGVYLARLRTGSGEVSKKIFRAR